MHWYSQSCNTKFKYLCEKQQWNERLWSYRQANFVYLNLNVIIIISFSWLQEYSCTCFLFALRLLLGVTVHLLEQILLSKNGQILSMNSVKKTLLQRSSETSTNFCLLWAWYLSAFDIILIISVYMVNRWYHCLLIVLHTTCLYPRFLVSRFSSSLLFYFFLLPFLLL